MPTQPPVHRPPGWKKPEPWAQNKHRSKQSRGYGAAWEALRARVLAEEPWCRYCLESGWKTPSTTVDHMLNKARGGTDDRENLCGCCTDHQRAKAGREGAIGRRLRIS